MCAKNKFALKTWDRWDLYRCLCMLRSVIFLFVAFVFFPSSGQTIVQKDVIVAPPDAPYTITPANGKVIFRAGSLIHLKADDTNPAIYFSVSEGSNFHAYIAPPFQESHSYAKVSKGIGTNYVMTKDNQLKFLYEERYTEGVLNYKIYNSARETNYLGALPVLNKVVGQNYFMIDLDGILDEPSEPDESDAYFVLELQNDKKESFFLRFKYLP